MLVGGCHCGEVRYETSGTPFHETICHCVDCRRISGAEAVAWFSVPRETLRWTVSDPASYSSSPTVTRRFCGVCGTTLTFEDSAHPDEVDVSISSLDDPGLVPPKDHLFASQRPAWAVISDGLPAYERRREGG